MSKQILMVKHKDEIILEILRLQQKKFLDEQIEAKAINHGRIQGLMFSIGLFDIFNNKQEEGKNDSINK